MGTIKFNILYFILLSLSLSCIDKKGIVKTESKKDEVTLTLNLPDSVIVSKPFKGLVEYFSSPLDTIELKEKDRRYIFLYLVVHRDSLNFEQLLKKDHDTFVAIDNNKIPLYNLISNEKGHTNLNGYIEDQVVIFDYKGDKEKSRVITNITEIFKRIEVVDSLKVVTKEIQISPNKT